MPALPLDEAGKYVAAAYLVFLALILIYVAIMAAKLQRIDRQLGDLADLAESQSAGASDEVAGRGDGPAARLAPEPAGDVAAGEASGGGVPEHSGGGVPS
jgi:predicted S18 family serine protease